MASKAYAFAGMTKMRHYPGQRRRSEAGDRQFAWLGRLRLKWWKGSQQGDPDSCHNAFKESTARVVQHHKASQLI